MKRTKKTQLHSVDRLMRNVASSLVRDFRLTSHDDRLSCSLERELRVGAIADVRAMLPAPDEEMDIPTYKAVYQIQSVLKRYRFENDLYSDQELEAQAVQGFLDTQSRLASLNLDAVGAKSTRVLKLAAGYIAKVLGVYSEEQHRSLCKFGRRASVGIPARLACLAARWELPISGSPEQIAWFDSEMSQVECVQEYWAAQKGSDLTRSTYQPTSSLTLTLVPKTYKALRSIMPNTTIGSYQSFGLGEMMRKALKRNGYDIRHLQQRHRYLAESASRHNHLVTADLSSASDSITVALVEKLFPPDWLAALHQSRIGMVSLPNVVEPIQSVTFCTMGIGYTFPLQTLVFLSLLKAIEHVVYHRRARRTLSVYGDDMIFPSAMYSTVCEVFAELGFVINIDKTYHDGHFRESCGGDYYHGVDVRPFQPRNEQAYVGNRTYEAVLYKYINGLLMRWTEYEIGNTLDYLTSELEALVHKVKIVPADFPDYSGVKCPYVACYEFLARAQVAQLKALGHGLYRFSYIGLEPDTREEIRHEPYLWERLAGPQSPINHYDNGDVVSVCESSVQNRIRDLVGLSDGEPALKTKKLVPRKTFRSALTGRRLCRTSTYVAISNTGRYTRQSGISGFENRR